MSFPWFDGTFIIDSTYWNTLLTRLALEMSQCQSMSIGYPEAQISFDGIWIKVWTTAGGSYPAITTPAHSKRGSFYLLARAKLKAPPDDTFIYFLFLEPAKGEFGDYTGMDTAYYSSDGYCCRNKRGGVETKTANIPGQDWKVEHEFKIQLFANLKQCKFFIDGGEIASHSSANPIASDPPWEFQCCEPNGVIRTVYLKYPPGLRWT